MHQGPRSFGFVRDHPVADALSWEMLWLSPRMSILYCGSCPVSIQLTIAVLIVSVCILRLCCHTDNHHFITQTSSQLRGRQTRSISAQLKQVAAHTTSEVEFSAYCMQLCHSAMIAYALEAASRAAFWKSSNQTCLPCNAWDPCHAYPHAAVAQRQSVRAWVLLA